MLGLSRFLAGWGLVAMTMAEIAPDTSVIDMLGMIPKCSVPCVFENVFQQGGCPFTNAAELSACACTNITLQSHLSACVQKSCGFLEQVDITLYSSRLCQIYPKESRVVELKTVSIVTIVLSGPFLILRLYTRWLKTRRWYPDDAFAIIVTVLLIAVSVIILRMSIMGFGLHYWNVPAANGVELLRYFYVCQMLYILVQVFSKVAILALYNRLFPDFIRQFHWSVRFMIAFMFVHGLVFFLLVVFQCLPIHAIWDKIIDGKCLSITAVIGFTGAGLGIAENFIILLLTVFELWKLQMSTKKKIGLIFLLGVGSFASITSIVRLRFMLKYANTYDSTWDNVDVIKWSLIEILSACICGNLLPLRPLVQEMMPSLRSVFSWYTGQSQKSSNMTLFGWKNRSRKIREKHRLISTLHFTQMSMRTGWNWQESDASDMASPTKPFPAHLEKSCESEIHDMGDVETQSVTRGMIRKTSTRVLNVAQASAESDITSRNGSESNLIPQRVDRDHRVSGPWSYSLSIFDRRRSSHERFGNDNMTFGYRHRTTE